MVYVRYMHSHLACCGDPRRYCSSNLGNVKKVDGVQTNTTSFSTTATTSVTISNEAFENEDLNSQDRRFVIDAKETGWTQYFG